MNKNDKKNNQKFAENFEKLQVAIAVFVSAGSVATSILAIWLMASSTTTTGCAI